MARKRNVADADDDTDGEAASAELEKLGNASAEDCYAELEQLIGPEATAEIKAEHDADLAEREKALKKAAA